MLPEQQGVVDMARVSIERAMILVNSGADSRRPGRYSTFQAEVVE